MHSVSSSVMQSELYDVSTQNGETARVQIRKSFVSKSNKAKALPCSQKPWQSQKHL